MGANMQRQAVPLIDPKAPFVGTGMEYQQPMTQELQLLHNMVVRLPMQMRIRWKSVGKMVLWTSTMFKNSVVQTPVQLDNQRTLVKVGETVEKGDFIADGPSMKRGNGPWSKPNRRLHDLGRV